jgi:hypothetical protein
MDWSEKRVESKSVSGVAEWNCRSGFGGRKTTMRQVIDFPAEVRPAEDMATLAAQINGEYAADEEATRKGLEHFRQAGEFLLRAKRQCGHGNGAALAQGEREV